MQPKSPIAAWYFNSWADGPLIAVDGPWEKQKLQTRLVFIAGSGTCNVSAIEKALNDCRANKL